MSQIIIIKSEEKIKRFLKFEGVKLDGVWIPEAIDWPVIRKAVINYAEQKISSTNNSWEIKDYKFIIENIDKYRKEFGGVILNGKKIIFCNMHLFYDSAKPAQEDFTVIEDGGSSVVRFFYDLQAQQIVKLEWNGEA